MRVTALFELPSNLPRSLEGLRTCSKLRTVGTHLVDLEKLVDGLVVMAQTRIMKNPSLTIWVARDEKTKYKERKEEREEETRTGQRLISASDQRTDVLVRRDEATEPSHWFS